MNEDLNLTQHEHIVATFWIEQQSEQYDLLLLEAYACACDTLPLLGQEVIIVSKLLPQQWERHMLPTIGNPIVI